MRAAAKKALLRRGRKLLQAYNRAVARRSPLGHQAFFDTALFPWIAELEAGWRAVRQELDGVLARPHLLPQFSEVSARQQHLAAYGKWKVFFFCAYGYRVEENCRRCPETVRLLGLIPGLQSAMFSVLEPDMHIKPHRGPYGGVLRYHLALKVPPPAGRCRLRVGDRTVSWEEGRSLVFDDTFEHEAWNECQAERVVLFVDFERPLPPPLRAVNRLLLRVMARTPLVQEGRRQYEEWRRRVGEPPTAPRPGPGSSCPR